MAGTGRTQGGGSGGKRPGAGRPPGRGRRLEFRSPAAPSLPADAVVTVDEEHAPDYLSVDERNVWLRLGPLAIEKGTLTKGTAYAFELLCRNIVLERRYAASVTESGGSSHRGMIQRVDAELGDFGLRA